MSGHTTKVGCVVVTASWDTLLFARCTILALLLLASVLPGAGASGPNLLFRNHRFDPLAGGPEIPANMRAAEPASGPGYYIVQFFGPVEQSWKDDVTAAGAELMDYIPEFAFIARMTRDAADAVRSLPQVRWVGPYHPAYAASAALAGVQGAVRLTVLLFPGENGALFADVVRRSAGEVHDSLSGPGSPQLEITLPAAAIPAIARHTGVSWVEPRAERKLFNNVSRELTNAPAVWTSPGLFGAGETVAVCDTGLDTGSQSTLSADFSGRLVKTYTLGRNNKWDDPDGHGTHVAGSVLGNGVLSGSNPATRSYTNSFAGVAPEAHLVFQSVLDRFGGLGGIPTNLTTLFQGPYNDGARIHNNSWGSSVAGAYNTDSRNVDVFTWNNPDMLTVFAAGNDGKDADSNGVVDPDSIGSPGTAKNCITVGASENYRLTGGAQGTYGGYWPSDFPVSPIRTDQVSNNASGMAAFSSRGPTDDGRIKPEVVAPGTNVISTRSHVSGAGTLWGAYNSHYVYSGGSSMSSPLVAGAAALVREYYRTVRGHAPSAALLKASILNAASTMHPGQYGTGSYLEIPAVRPNNVEGWGLVDVAAAVAPHSPVVNEFVDNTQGLTTGGSVSYPYRVTVGSHPVRVTLAWTDYPASTAASKTLVNDLDLIVTLPDGSTRRGNGAVDRTNNVETVEIPAAEAGLYTVTVSAYNVPNGPQKFAVAFAAATGALPPAAIVASPSQGTPLAGPVHIRGTASGGGFQQYALDYGAGTSPSIWMPIVPPQTTQVDSGVLGVWNTDQLPDGDYTIRLTADGTGGSSTALVTVQVLATRIYTVRNAADGSTVALTGKIVSSGAQDLDGVIYVQEPDRSSGIRVELGAQQTDAAVGDRVSVVGTLQTSAGERAIVNPQVYVTGAGAGP